MLDRRIANIITNVKKLSVILAALTLLAVLTLQARPIGVAVFGISPDPASIEIIGRADGSHFCKVKSDCLSITATHLGMDLDLILPLRLSSLAVLLLVVPVAFVRPKFYLLLITPPPQRAAFA